MGLAGLLKKSAGFKRELMLSVRYTCNKSENLAQSFGKGYQLNSGGGCRELSFCAFFDTLGCIRSFHASFASHLLLLKAYWL
jgi:hypothetical protein